MKLEQTNDADFIRSIVTHDSVWPHVVDEGSDKATWTPTNFGIWLRCEGVAGVVLVYRVSGIVWAYDVALLPEARGGAVGMNERRSYIEMLKEWMRANTDCHRLVAFIAADNKRSIRAAEADGLRPEGIIPEGKRRGDGFIDAVVMGTGV